MFNYYGDFYRCVKCKQLLNRLKVAKRNDGVWISKISKNHPNEQSNATSNRSTFSTKSKAITTQNGDRVLDISEWQGNLTDAQVKQLKRDYDFIIIRGQYGSEYVDQCLENNSALLDKNNMKFGVYSYSLYENADDARNELKRFIVVHLKLHSM